VEVHYYRDRDKSQFGFHKDTKGQTLFVNLNYHVPQQVVGPEVVINPPHHEGHDAQIEQSLPPEVLRDLHETRRALPHGDEYLTGIVDPYGAVAFVDEAVHHATPNYGHRSVSGSELELYLKQTHPEQFTAAQKDYSRMKEDRSEGATPPLSPVDSSTIKAPDAKWLAWMKLIEKKDAAYTREDLAGTMSPKEIDRMLEVVAAFPDGSRQGTAGFHAASLPPPGQTSPLSAPIQPPGGFLSPIKPEGAPPLRRQMSDPDFRKTMPPQIPSTHKRQFFRTWVRVVPASLEIAHPTKVKPPKPSKETPVMAASSSGTGSSTGSKSLG
jgi:hypothetical protein